MRKIIFLILSVFLAFTFALSGCSCEASSYLEFENGATTNIKTERLVYSVEYTDTYKGIVCAQSINKDLVPKYENGQLVIEYDSTGRSLPSGITQHIKFDNITTFNYIKTVFSIDVVVGEGQSEQRFNDKIISEVYFYDAEWAFAPVYSKTTVKNTYIAMSSSQIATDQNIYEYTSTYKNEKFALTKKYYKADANENVNLVDIEQDDFISKLKPLSGNGNSYEYERRKTIDNVQLLFIARNINLKKGKSKSIPTITYMYNQAKSMLITNNSQSSVVFDQLKFQLNNNLQTLENVNMPVNNLFLAMDGTEQVGLTKYLTLQNAKVGDIENYAIPVEYAEPIMENQSFNTVGALVYKLKEINITTK